MSLLVQCAALTLTVNYMLPAAPLLPTVLPLHVHFFQIVYSHQCTKDAAERRLKSLHDHANFFAHKCVTMGCADCILQLHNLLVALDQHRLQDIIDCSFMLPGQDGIYSTCPALLTHSAPHSPPLSPLHTAHMYLM